MKKNKEREDLRLMFKGEGDDIQYAWATAEECAVLKVKGWKWMAEEIVKEAIRLEAEADELNKEGE